MTAAIRIEHLVRRFHDLVAVDDISFEVAEGEVFGFLGPNGAGKSTTIRILTGFLPASSGRAEVFGHDVARQSLPARRLIGYLPENVPLPLDARVDEYLEYRARLKGVGARERKGRREKVLAHCGLETMRRRILGQLSRGYRQRVGLADALIADPPLLVLDEPTGGLDPGQRQEVLDLVGRLKGERTVLLSSHVLAEVEQISSRVAIIQHGRLLALGTKQELEQAEGRQGLVAVSAGPDAGALLAWLSSHGHGAERIDGGLVHVRLPNEAEPARLLSELVGAGLPVDRFEPLTRSLHEIFLELTRAPPVASAAETPA